MQETETLMTDRKAKVAVATAKSSDMSKSIVLGGAILMGAALLAGQAKADSHENITISHGVTNFGTLKYGPDFSHLDYVNPEAPKGGEISQWAQGTFDSFNQYSRKGVSAALNTIPYENILVSTADDPYGTYCYLCETMEYPDDRSWVIFNLREDVTFSDGSPMTAEDLKFTFDMFSEQGIAEYRNIIEGFVDSVEVLDTHRIKFTFTDAAPRRDIIGIAGGTPVFSKTWFEETGTRLDEASEEPFLGSGAYLLDSYDINRRIVYRKDPNWWGADVPFNVGRSNFETIRVEYFADSSAAFEGFKSGAYTFRSENSSKEWATGYDFPALDKGWVLKEELPNGSIGTPQSFVFNLDKERWQDPRVREALGLMFNFEWSNESLFFGLYERVNSFWENSDLEARGVPSDVELALLQPLVDQGQLDPAILTSEPVMAPTSRSAERSLDRGNLRRASALLDEAGWIAGDDGMRRKNGEVLTASFLQYSPAFDRIVNPIIENMQRLGVDATLDRVDTSQYIDRRRTGDFDLVNHTFGMGLEPGVGLRQWYGSETADDSSRNLMRLRNPAIDQLLTHVIDAQTLEDLTTATHALDRVLRAERFWIPQWFKDVHTVAYYDMYRYPTPLPPYARGELDFWWFDADAAENLTAAGAFQ
jgi:microcin C transport system substrate-binding protein